MKPAFETISSSGNSSFLVRKFEEKVFKAPYHFHPEYELTLIINGWGKRYVGTHMSDYLPGDLVLLGSNVPHCWKTENTMPGETSSSVVIHFNPDFMGADFFAKPEMKSIIQLLNNSNYGIQFIGDTAAFKNKMILLLKEKNTFKKLMMLLETDRKSVV